MENNLERIDRYFKERLDSLEQEPRDLVWKNIVAKLGHNRQKRIMYLMIRIAAGMTLLVSLGIGIALVSKQGRQHETVLLTGNMTNDSVVRQNDGSGALQPGDKPEKSDRLKPVRKVYEGPKSSIPAETDSRDRDKNPLLEGYLNREPAGPPPVLVAKQGRFESLPAVYIPEQLYTFARIPAVKETPSPEPESLYDVADITAEEIPAGKRRQWTLGSEVAPLYSYRTISSDYLDKDILEDLNHDESGLMAYAGGVNVSFSSGRRFSIQSGVYYSRYGQEKNNLNTYKAQYAEVNSPTSRSTTYVAISNSTGTISTNPRESDYNKVITTPGTASNMDYTNGFTGIYATPETEDESNISASQYFDYLEIPLTMKYKVVDRKLDFSLLGGLVTNFLVGNSVYLNQEDGSNSLGKTSGINTINYLGSVGLGLEYPVMKKVSFSLEPRFRYYINPIDNSSQINVHPYSFGIFAGFCYIFK